MNVKEKAKSKLAKIAKRISAAYKIFPAVEARMFSEERSPVKSCESNRCFICKRT